MKRELSAVLGSRFPQSIYGTGPVSFGKPALNHAVIADASSTGSFWHFGLMILKIFPSFLDRIYLALVDPTGCVC